MEVKQIHSKFTDTGHWLARCNHDTGLIELNRRDFPRLSPMMQDYIWVHEYVHLLYGIHDENQTNAIADKIFISRAATPQERAQREAFVSNSEGSAMSGIAITAIVGLVTTAVSLGIKAYQVFGKAKEGGGYYGLSSGDQYLLVKDLVNASFVAAKNSGVSPQSIFWSQMSQCAGVESDYNAWLANNSFANGIITEYEKAYNQKFNVAAPVSLWSKPIVKYSVIALAIAAAVLVFLKLRKKH